MQKNNVNICLPNDMISNCQNQNTIITGITTDHRQYTELSLIAEQHNCSISTLRRRLKKLSKTEYGLYTHRMEGKIYVTDAILSPDIKRFSKLNDFHGNFAKYIESFEWDFFVTVRFPYRYSQETVRKRAHTYFEKLSSVFNGKGIRFFFTLENAYLVDEGFHIHFYTWVDTEKKGLIKTFTESHFRGSGKRFANTHMEKYDPKLGGAYYMFKEQNYQKDGYDFLHKNL